MSSKLHNGYTILQTDSNTSSLLQYAWLPMALLLILGLALRLSFIQADGFKSDISSFEGWTLGLLAHPTADFYSTQGFADYPPGYLYVLIAVGHIYKALIHSDDQLFWLKIAVKMPGIVFDLIDSWLVYLIVRRFASAWQAYVAAACVALNPAFIIVSGFYGQVDSVPAQMTLLAVLLIIRAYRLSGWALFATVTGAWLLVSVSILMKPAAVVVAILFALFPFMRGITNSRRERAVATATGLFAALLIALLLSAPFHPSNNPTKILSWLYERYHFASNVYPYNSVNAFNLYSIAQKFWQPDGQVILSLGSLGIERYEAGIVLFVGATIILGWKLLERQEEIAFLEAAMMLSLAYFVLLTRMHERYVFNAVMLIAPLVFFRRRYLIALALLSLTLLLNLYYTLVYQAAVTGALGIVDSTNLLPLISKPASVLNVLIFLYLGFSFFGSKVRRVKV